MGGISLWEVSSGEKLFSRHFQVWNIGASSMMLKVCFLLSQCNLKQVNSSFHQRNLNSKSDHMQATLIKDPCVSVKRIAWTLDGSLFGEIKEMHYTIF